VSQKIKTFPEKYRLDWATKKIWVLESS